MQHEAAAVFNGAKHNHAFRARRGHDFRFSKFGLSFITVDFGTLGEDEKQGLKDTVTIRDRDSLKQERVGIEELVQHLQ